MLDTGCWMLDARYWMLDTGCSMLDTGCWMQRYWLLEKGQIFGDRPLAFGKEPLGCKRKV